LHRDVIAEEKTNFFCFIRSNANPWLHCIEFRFDDCIAKFGFQNIKYFLSGHILMLVSSPNSLYALFPAASLSPRAKLPVEADNREYTHPPE